MKAIASTITLTLAVVGLAAAQSTTGSGQDLCQCYSEYATCNYEPTANHAGCYAAYEKCVGYTPSGPITVPEYCTVTTSQPPSTTIITHSVPTTASPAGNECQCYSDFRQCSYGPSANHAGCAAKYAQCLGISGTGDVPIPTTCSTSTVQVWATSPPNYGQGSGVVTNSISVSPPMTAYSGAADKVVIGGSGLFAAVVAIIAL